MCGVGFGGGGRGVQPCHHLIVVGHVCKGPGGAIILLHPELMQPCQPPQGGCCVSLGSCSCEACVQPLPQILVELVGEG